jgi:hypothetical protein
MADEYDPVDVLSVMFYHFEKDEFPADIRKIDTTICELSKTNGDIFGKFESSDDVENGIGFLVTAGSLNYRTNRYRRTELLKTYVESYVKEAYGDKFEEIGKLGRKLEEKLSNQ